MAVSRRLSEREIEQISRRMKSARALTGLNQDNFAAQNNISLTSLKCWEMGRAVPRQEGLSNFLSAIKKHGIDVAFEWIFYGSGPGPTYVEGTQTSRTNRQSDYLEQQIKLFQNHIRAKGLNPIVMEVPDDSAEPHFAKGDVVGGYYVALENLIKEQASSSIHKSPWLLAKNDGNFMLVSLLIVDKSEQIFYRKNELAPLEMLTSSLVGRVCWHYKG